jgi:subtilisin family serine protease
VIRIALIDSGVDARDAPRVVAARAFLCGEAREEAVAGGRTRQPAAPAAALREIQEVAGNVLGHGPALAKLLLADPRVELIVARVFGDALVTSAAQLAAALDWCAEQGARVANVSAGLREDREVLRRAVAKALAGGVIVVAAAPARGAPVYPAAYPRVVRATGDARCAPGEWSWLGSAQADFGAHVRAGDVRGASAGCARVCAHLAAQLADGLAPAAALAALRERAHYRGVERRFRS